MLFRFSIFWVSRCNLCISRNVTISFTSILLIYDSLSLLLLFSQSVVSHTLWPHGLQHTRLPCLFTISWTLLTLMSIESVMPSNHLILCRPLLLLPSIFPSIRVFSIESALHIRWPKYWSFSFSISPSNDIQGWFPLGWTGCISLLSKRISRVFSSTVQRHQFFGAQPFFLSSSHICTWLLEKS